LQSQVLFSTIFAFLRVIMSFARLYLFREFLMR